MRKPILLIEFPQVDEETRDHIWKSVLQIREYLAEDYYVLGSFSLEAHEVKYSILSENMTTEIANMDLLDWEKIK